MSYIQISNHIEAPSVSRSVRNPHTPLRICHLSKYYPPQPGGIETHVRAIATSQAALGAKVDVLCVNTCDREGREAQQTHTIEELDGNVRVIRLGRLLNVARVDVFTTFSQYFDRRRAAYDIAHLHTPNPAMGMHWALANSTIPLVVTHHSDIVKQRVLKHVVNPMLKHIYHRAARVLIGSPNYLAGSDFLRPYRDRVEVLPFGIDLSIYRQPTPAAIAYERRLRAMHSGPIWLCVGRLVYYKALHVAIAALRDVPGTLMIVGKGELADALQRQAMDIGVGDRVVFKQQLTQDELVGAYRASTALWFPSNARSEAFGLVQVEAMASGCPVINTAIPKSGVTWVSRGGIEGLTVPMNDAEALAEAANRLLREPQLRGKLSIASRTRSLQFDQDLMAQESLRIYERAINRKETAFV
ncbi:MULTISPECIES: glycosyltransferase [Leptolyngbya]|uniref:glycosyltransferase n=1 Tax=Leptolyngbya TaxID=47251 RepID=UPI001687E0F2|nr:MULTISPECIES: glycosyltransferase [unclassified Leptolyngbya]MBD1858306.1 glycosyltransferase [Leptolyngbya sp. FACHB-1624]MCY6494506.1 glycosyltransferase [Leptolyngbya sp. GGD]